ncbi:hypothetical protein GEMRC1_008761 [Eukaryota sp. GEM-RC1]
MAHSVLQSWRSIEYSKLLTELTTSISELNASKEFTSLAYLKDLADTTKAFQQLTSNQKLDQINSLLKQYQDSKVVKTIASRLSLAPDPVPTLESLLDSQNLPPKDTENKIDNLTTLLVERDKELSVLQEKYEDLVLSLVSSNEAPKSLPAILPSDNLELQRDLTELRLKYDEQSNFVGELTQVKSQMETEMKTILQENAYLKEEVELLSKRPSGEEFSELSDRFNELMIENQSIRSELGAVSSRLPPNSPSTDAITKSHILKLSSIESK